MKPARLHWEIALRQTITGDRGLSTFLSRLSAVGMVVAVGLLLAVLSIMNGFEREMRERILELVPHVTIRGSADEDDWREVEEAIASTPTVTSYETFFDADGLFIRGREAAVARVVGIDAGGLGRYQHLLTPLIDSLGTRDIVLGKTLAESMGLREGDAVSVLLSASYADASISPSGVTQRFRVASILNSGTELDRQLALGAQSTIAAMTPNQTQNGLSVQIQDVLQAPRLRFQLSQSLPIGLWVSDWTATQGNLYRAIQLSRQIVVLLLVSLIAIAVFNIVTSLILVVTDRRPAIAMLRTMGLQKADVTLVFMLQGGLIGAIGGLLGCLLGFVLAVSAPQLSALLEWLSGQPLLNTQVYPLDFVPVDIRWIDFVLVPGIAFVLALLASSIPARQAAGATITDALSQSR